MFSSIAESKPLFGAPAFTYGNIISVVVQRVRNVQYSFVENEPFFEEFRNGTVSISEVNRVIAREVVDTAHLNAVTSIVRGARWFEATWRQYKQDNLLGWAACCRSLLEATGDTVHGLGSTALHIAENMDLLGKGLNGFENGILQAQGIEQPLIHFGHGRRLTKEERQCEPELHAAKHTTAYVDYLEKAGITGAAKLYSELCQIAHPARESLSYLYVGKSANSFAVDPERDKIALAGIVQRNRDILHALPSVTFNPGLLILRALVKFRLFPTVPELRRFEFQGAQAWTKLKALLHS